MSVKTWGYSSRWLPRTWIRYSSIGWRFLAAIDTTSIAVQAPSALSSVSTGLPPRFDLRSSKASSWPLLGIASKRISPS